MTKNQDKELIDCALSMMYLGTRKLMHEPGYLYNKTMTIQLAEDIVDEAIKQFVTSTHRTVFIRAGDEIHRNPNVYKDIPRDRSAHVVSLPIGDHDELIASANIIVIDPLINWGALDPLLNGVLFRVGRKMREFAVVRMMITPTCETLDKSNLSEDERNFLTPYYWSPHVPSVAKNS